jgi:chemotaxis family two-component system sensor kinase Cph1
MPDTDASRIQVDLTNCDREPIHVPGAILPHGVMLVLDCDSLAVLQAAGDTEALLNQPLAGLPGRGMDTLLRPDQIGLLRILAAEPGLTRPRYLLDPALRVAADQPVDASVYRSGRLLVMEFEAANPADRFATDPLLAVHGMLEGLDRAPSVAAICHAAAERVRRVTGYDRVMVYRFLDDESGQVIAESKRDNLASFLDLHYPESDIPRQARALYLKSPLRLITQVDYQPARLVPADNPLTGEPLDMSFATLRDVSPIHREYLRNMGVDASMSVSIVLKGRLWGLIACHHETPLRLPRHLRAVCELFGSMLSLQLDVQLGREQFNDRLKSRDVLQRMMLHLAVEDAYAPGMVHRSSELLDYIQADGLCLFEDTGGVPALFGRTPSPAELAALIGWLSQRMDGEEPFFATDRLAELWPAARAYSETASGLLAILVSREPRRFILWFRTEIVHTVTWGGDPTKPANPGPDTSRLSPRASFNAWKQIVRGRSRPWTQSDRDAALDLRVALLEVVLRRIEATAAERQRAHEHEKLLIAELDHRVKNTLGVIQSLVVQTSRSATSMTEFVTGLERRIRSMAQSHSLLTRSHWNGIEIHTLLREELDQYGLDGAAVTLTGPDFVLTPKAALALSLAIHELATNAAKYGALSTHQGAVAVSWGASADGGIELCWRESGGPAVSPPLQRGFGSRLIEQALTMETGGRSTMRFPPDGVHCDIVLPASSVAGTIGETAAPAAQGRDAEPPAAPRQSRPRILLVEDSYLISLLLEQVIEDQDWELVGPATRVPAALALARTEQIDAALLDINLDGVMSWPVAMALRERGIPFAFSTGYGSAPDVPESLTDVLVLKKPFQLAEVESRMQEMLRGAP